MDPKQELSTLTDSLRRDWDLARDSVRRLILLRNFFHSVHELINQSLAQETETPSSVDELHHQLSNLSDRLRGLETQTLDQLLQNHLDPLALVAPQAIPLPSDSRTEPEIPRPLLQPGREWEKMIFELGLLHGWAPQKSPVRIESPSDLRVWIQKSKLPPMDRPTQVILALERNLTEPPLWWLHTLSSSH